MRPGGVKTSGPGRPGGAAGVCWGYSHAYGAGSVVDCTGGWDSGGGEGGGARKPRYRASPLADGLGTGGGGGPTIPVRGNPADTAGKGGPKLVVGDTPPSEERRRGHVAGGSAAAKGFVPKTVLTPAGLAGSKPSTVLAGQMGAASSIRGAVGGLPEAGPGAAEAGRDSPQRGGPANGAGVIGVLLGVWGGIDWGC